MIHLKGNLYSVEVPSDENVLQIVPNHVKDKYFLCYKLNGKHLELGIPFGLEILGEVTKDDFSFDVEPYVLEPIELNQEDYEGNMVLKSFYWDYNLEYYWLTSFEESYRTLLESKGIDLNKENVKLIILEKL